jgi:DNA-binding MarR family transcriptional regulator
MDDHELGRNAALIQEAYSAGQLVALLVNEELEAVGVTPQLFSFLGFIRMLAPITPSELAAETGMPPTTIRDYVRRLVQRGDIRRARNPADGRSYHIVLTAQGRRLADRGWPAVKAAYARVAPHLEQSPEAHLAAARELRSALKLAIADRQLEAQEALRAP